MNYIFVYGSLMQNFRNYNKYLIGMSEFIDTGYLEGELYHLPQGYPALISGKGIVRGEIFKIKNVAVIDTLDILEGYLPGSFSNYYNRESKKVKLSKGGEINCWVYIYADEVYVKKHGTRIPDGDWKDYIKGMENKE